MIPRQKHKHCFHTMKMSFCGSFILVDQVTCVTVSSSSVNISIRAIFRLDVCPFLLLHASFHDRRVWKTMAKLPIKPSRDFSHSQYGSSEKLHKPLQFQLREKSTMSDYAARRSSNVSRLPLFRAVIVSNRSLTPPIGFIPILSDYSLVYRLK